MENGRRIPQWPALLGVLMVLATATVTVAWTLHRAQAEDLELRISVHSETTHRDAVDKELFRASIDASRQNMEGVQRQLTRMEDKLDRLQER